jgi:crotonobetainyl-CoA:carnitine CoA-transferase CaiB-like acyl-CoA transferase
MLANQSMNFLTTGAAPARMGNAHPNIVPYQAFATADGHIILAVGNDAQFARFCTVAGVPEDPRFRTNAQRVNARAALVPVLDDILATRTSADWLAALEAVGVPCGPINTLDQVFADPQVQARGLRQTLPHPMGGTVDQVACPIRYSGTPLDTATAPPTLGQHTDEVLRTVVDAERIAELRKAGVV